MSIKIDIRHKPLDGDLLLTMACPVGCDFCVYSCLPSLEPQKWMPEETIRRVAEEYSKNDIEVRICGGEPFYNLEKLKKCIEILLEYYEPSDLNIITSAIFAGSKKNAIRNLDVLKQTNFDRIIVSVDRFHLPRVPFKKLVNVIEASQEIGIEIILRLSMDSSSFVLLDKVSNLIVKYQIPIEVHRWYAVGRGENIDRTTLRNYDFVEKYLFNKIALNGRKYNKPKDYRYYLTRSAKRSEKNYANDFFPTTFPNGNIYATSFTFKSQYLGNVNNENLLQMLLRFEKTFSGHFVLSDNSNFNLRKFLPLKYHDDPHDMLRNEPFTEDMNDEAVGRVFIRINSDDNLDEILNKIIKRKTFHGPYGVGNREFLLSFRLKENDLWNAKSRLRILNFLNKLKALNIKFVLSRSLPPCLKIETDSKQPKNCFECRELFTVRDGKILFCDCLKSREGPLFANVKNRDEIFEFYKERRKEEKLLEICSKCLFHIRNQCEGFSK